MNYARSKVSMLLLSLAVSLTVLLAWSQSWITLTSTLLSSIGTQDFSGDIVAPSLPGLVFLSMATVAVMSISGRVLRKILAIVLALAGMGIFLLSLSVLSDPLGSSLSQLTVLTGIDNTDEVSSLVDGIFITAWPYISAAAGLLIVFLSIIIFFTSAKWVSSGRKYDTNSPSRSESKTATQSEKNIDQWDTLSKGTDPTTD